MCASLVPPGPLPTSPVRGEAPRSIFGRRVPRGGGGLCGLGAALQWTSCCFLGQQTLAQRARRPWLARVELVGELVRKAQLGHQPNLGFCLLVSQQTLALYFFFAFFCASSFFLLAPRNRCRSRWHSIGLPSCPSAVVVYLLHARGEAQHRQTECQRPGPTAPLTFFGTAPG